MKTVYTRPKLLKEADFHYCPGCGHGIVHRLLVEVIEELDLRQTPSAWRPPGAACSPTTTSTST